MATKKFIKDQPGLAPGTEVIRPFSENYTQGHCDLLQLAS